VALDPHQVDPAAGRVLEGAVVGGMVDAPHLLVRQADQLRRVREPGQVEQAEDDVAAACGVGDDHLGAAAAVAVVEHVQDVQRVVRGAQPPPARRARQPGR
jgi:hypothetical protein